MLEPAFLRASIVAFAEEIAATPVETPSRLGGRRTKRQVLMDAITGAADLLHLDRATSPSATTEQTTPLSDDTLRPAPQNADDPATVDGVAGKAQPRAGGSS